VAQSAARKDDTEAKSAHSRKASTVLFIHNPLGENFDLNLYSEL
jgi:hypothetical protein